MRALLTALSLALVASLAHAQNTPVGLWKTIDDDGKTEKSLVRIFEEGGVVFGKIEQIFAEKDRNANCEKCKDERKGKPVLGMLIIRNLKQDSDDPALWLSRRRHPRPRQGRGLQDPSASDRRRQAPGSAWLYRCAAVRAHADLGAHAISTR